MKNKWWIAGSLITALVGLCVAMILIARNSVETARDSGVRLVMFSNNMTPATADETRTLETGGPVTLTVDNRAGNVNIVSGEDGQVRVVMHKTAYGATQSEAEANLEELQVSIQQQGDRITIAYTAPEVIVVMGSGQSDTVDFTITVPVDTIVEAGTSFGDMRLSGTRGGAHLQTEFGRIEASDLTGALSLKTNSGDITASDVTAPGAEIVLDTEFGDITLKQASAKTVTITTNSGTVTCEDVHAGGAIDIRGEFGSVSFTVGAADSLTARTNSGRITLERVRVAKTVSVRSEFGDLNLIGVTAAGYDLGTNNGAITLDGAQGSIKIDSEFGSVTLRNTAASTLEVRTNNGQVEFTGTLGEGPHVIASEFGSVTLHLPEQARLDVDLKTEFGNIRTDIPLTINGEAGEDHMTGTLNGGGASLTVSTNSGDIRIKIQK